MELFLEGIDGEDSEILGKSKAKRIGLEYHEDEEFSLFEQDELNKFVEASREIFNDLE